MACARCDFYLPKQSTKAQSIEAKANLLRLRQEIPLSEDELRALEDGIAGHEKLVAKLVSCPTPASNRLLRDATYLYGLGSVSDSAISHSLKAQLT